MTDDNLKTESEASTVKRIIIFLWLGLGSPGAWVLLMMVSTLADILVDGADMIFITFGCLFAYFLSRIARAVEIIAGI